MTEYEVMSILKQHKAGTLVRITYQTFPTVCAKARDEGYEVKKVTSTTVRCGVAYESLKAVKQERAAHPEKEPKKPWYSWKVPKYIQESKAGKTYLSVAPMPKNNRAKSNFTIYKNGEIQEFSQELLKEIVIPSYWKSEAPKTLSVELNNILSIKINKKEVKA